MNCKGGGVTDSARLKPGTVSNASSKGLTLIELLVAVSIASMVTLGIQQLLDTALTAWRVSIEEVTIGRLSEGVMQEMMEGTDEFAGIRDAVEIVEAAPASVQFVPMWFDLFHRLPEDGKFYLTKRLRPGTPPPVCEIKFPGAEEFQTYPAAFHGHDAASAQWIDFGFPIKRGSAVLVGYQPDARIHPDLIMDYHWEAKTGKLLRRYNRLTTEFALRREGIKITSVRFVYYDGRNREVEVPSAKSSKISALSQITAIKIILGFEGKEFKRQNSSLINIRALGKTGQGILLSEGLEVPIPDSEHIRIFQLVNLTGVHEGNVIELKIGSPNIHSSWRLKLILGKEEDTPLLTRYEIYYPQDQLVVERSEEFSLAQGLDLLSIDFDGLYDYDDDPSVTDQVMFKGNEITLSVIRSDPEGVMVVVRP
jgi:prepilin-type N-terminal cleavage/methylation domain-containing protein